MTIKDFFVGESTLPEAYISPITKTYLEQLDPELYKVLDFLVYFVNKELDTFFQAYKLTKPEITFTKLLELNKTYNIPLHYFATQNFNDLPMLVVETKGIKALDFSAQKKKFDQQYSIMYIFPALTSETMATAYALFTSVCTTMLSALSKNTKDNTQLIWHDVDFRYGENCKFQSLAYDDSPNAKLFPTFTIDLIISKYMLAGPSALNAILYDSNQVIVDSMEENKLTNIEEVGFEIIAIEEV